MFYFTTFSFSQVYKTYNHVVILYKHRKDSNVPAFARASSYTNKRSNLFIKSWNTIQASRQPLWNNSTENERMKILYQVRLHVIYVHVLVISFM